MAREISRRGEYGGLLDLRHELDRLFEDFFEVGSGPIGRRGEFVPRIELREEDQRLSVRAELPGLKPEDVSIDVDGNVLTIRGERKRETQQSRGGFEYSESSYGSFVRSIQLPTGIDVSKVEARMDHGILDVSVPKSESARARKIPVRATGEQGTPTVQQSSPAPSNNGGGGRSDQSQSQRSASKP